MHVIYNNTSYLTCDMQAYCVYIQHLYLPFLCSILVFVDNTEWRNGELIYIIFHYSANDICWKGTGLSGFMCNLTSLPKHSVQYIVYEYRLSVNTVVCTLHVWDSPLKHLYDCVYIVAPNTQRQITPFCINFPWYNT